MKRKTKITITTVVAACVFLIMVVLFWIWILGKVRTPEASHSYSNSNSSIASTFFGYEKNTSGSEESKAEIMSYEEALKRGQLTYSGYRYIEPTSEETIILNQEYRDFVLTPQEGLERSIWVYTSPGGYWSTYTFAERDVFIDKEMIGVQRGLVEVVVSYNYVEGTETSGYVEIEQGGKVTFHGAHKELDTSAANCTVVSNGDFYIFSGPWKNESLKKQP